MTDVFISYAHQNAEIVKQLYTRLQEEGFTSWVNWDKLEIGPDEQQEIFDSIEGAPKFLCILSDDWWKTESCHIALKHARDHNKIIIPVVYQESQLVDVGGSWLEQFWEDAARDNWYAVQDLPNVLFHGNHDFEAGLTALIDLLRENQPPQQPYTDRSVPAYDDEATRADGAALAWTQAISPEELAIDEAGDHRGELLNALEEVVVQRKSKRQARLFYRLRLVFFGLALLLIVMSLVIMRRSFQQEANNQAATAVAEQEHSLQFEQTVATITRREVLRTQATATTVQRNVLHAQETAEAAQAAADRRSVAAEYVNFGSWEFGQGEYETAIEDFTRAIEIDPEYALAYSRRGLTYYDLGEYEQAIADYTRAIELDPKDIFYYTDRGNAYRELGEYEQAIADYNRAIEVEPTSGWAYVSRGNIYKELGEYEQAIAEYDYAIELDPTDDWAYSNRADAALWLAPPNCTLAIVDIAQVEILNPDSPWLPFIRSDSNQRCNSTNTIPNYPDGTEVLLPVSRRIAISPGDLSQTALCNGGEIVIVKQTILHNDQPWVEITCSGGTGWLREEGLVPVE